MKKFFSIVSVLLVGLMVMGSTESEPVSKIKITNDIESKVVGVELINGKNRLLTSSITVIEQLFGRDNQASTWVYIGTDIDATGVGAAGDTIRIQIPAAVTPIGTVYPACDVTTTVTASHVSDPNPEAALAKTMASDFNTDSNCKISWKSEVIKNFSGVFMASKIFNEWGERTTWTVSTTGTTTFTKAWDDVARRGLETELTRSPNNPRSGILAIAGSVTQIPGSISEEFFIPFENGGSGDMTVNGSSTAVDFRVEAEADKRLIVQKISCYGGGNGIKFGQFLSKSGGPLTNGVEISLKSDDETFTFPVMTTTEDWKNLFAFRPGTDFRIDIQAGQDQFVSAFIPSQPIPIEPIAAGLSVADFLQVKIQDNLATGLANFECSVTGFREDF